jgi:hypothetical protein
MTTMSTQSLQPEFVRLYEQAFEKFGAMTLWSSRPVANPTPADALAITHSLRVEGNLDARRLPEQIEQACMLLSKIQSEILQLLASHRDPESYVAGSTPLNRTAPRYSGGCSMSGFSDMRWSPFPRATAQYTKSK